MLLQNSEGQGIQLSVDDSVHVIDSSVATLTAYRSAEQLISLARTLIDTGEGSIATVVLHMACEIATESCMSAGLAASDAEHFEGPVGEFLNGYSFLQKRNRNRYNLVTGDEIQKQGFWKELLESTDRRNCIVHRGLQVSATDAESSFSAVGAAVRHISARERTLRSS